MEYIRQLLFVLTLLRLAPNIQGIICWECENVFSQRDCLTVGKLTDCDETQNACQIELRHGGWGNQPQIKKSCKQLTACGNNHIQDSHPASVFIDDRTQCNMKAPSSVCRCCCTRNGCNHEILFCNEPLGGLPCPDLRRPRNGFMKCNNEPLGRCQFSCRRGFGIDGAAIANCDLFSRWDAAAPVCRRIRCRRLARQRFGSFRCTNRNWHRSICRFTCNEGFELDQDYSAVQCIPYRDNDIFGAWNRPQPLCKPIAPRECPAQRIANGQVRCTEQNFAGSTCTFSCDESRGYMLSNAGRRRNTCQFNELWNQPAPCCTRSCPPYAVMDFIVILDSSSSVGEDNWVKMKAFVRSFLDDFAVSDDASHFSIIRYNNEVDVDTQILLNDYPNSLDDLLVAYDKIPYNGRGTRTGNALNYAADVLITTGNRPEARDVVLLITDGASRDEVGEPAGRLHDAGALVFVLPVLPPRGGRLDLDEILSITRNEENILRDALERGFEALDEEFAARISSLLCEDPCPLNI
ncbi:unnamed protein product [Clavelina lepadiformis]|uniref:Uncharacterized protein n=1 Tax=Clavelina lepadiformis TaxID=159417 RepID=A0ABP0GHI7_CLALP